MYKNFSLLYILIFYDVIIGLITYIIIHTSSFACLRGAACERYAFAGSRLSGVSKNYAVRLANMSRPSGSSSTYKHLQFMDYKIQN